MVPVCFPSSLRSSIALSISSCRTRAGDDSRDGVPMPGDDDGLATLHLIEEPGKMCLGFGGLNFARHHRALISRLDQSISSFADQNQCASSKLRPCHAHHGWAIGLSARPDPADCAKLAKPSLVRVSPRLSSCRYCGSRRRRAPRRARRPPVCRAAARRRGYAGSRSPAVVRPLRASRGASPKSHTGR